jgi:hypothetical protein
MVLQGRGFGVWRIKTEMGECALKDPEDHGELSSSGSFTALRMTAVKETETVCGY